ncbi:hypothetical protein [Breoghania sp.]|uniref:hypothetical protein n=1 Tax=Breoghania sp. TaxID=2065378 RepID=UPI00261622A4|nr:hypothetical protein [Breoghania sp.]MDJ0932755.1 hypothetical protein [Breoghania sp.]
MKNKNILRGVGLAAIFAGVTVAGSFAQGMMGNCTRHDGQRFGHDARRMAHDGRRRHDGVGLGRNG